MDFSNHYCPNEECENYGKQGQRNIALKIHMGKNKDIKLLYCKTCGQTFSENRNTMFFQLKTSKEKVINALNCLVEGNSIRATSRITGLSTNTISGFLNKAAEHVEKVSNHVLKDIECKEVQLDELWAFIKKKKKIYQK